MYIVKSKEKFKTSEDAVWFLLSCIGCAGVEDEFEIVKVDD